MESPRRSVRWASSNHQPLVGAADADCYDADAEADSYDVDADADS